MGNIKARPDIFTTPLYISLLQIKIHCYLWNYLVIIWISIMKLFRPSCLRNSADKLPAAGEHGSTAQQGSTDIQQGRTATQAVRHQEWCGFGFRLWF